MLMKVHFCFLGCLLLCISQLAIAQIRTGQVTDENNLPLPGATVVVEGTTRGTTTDFDGNFQIEAAARDVRAGILGYQGARLRNMGKYPDINGWDNIPIIRYEEVILNYAEALAESGNSSAALEQLTALTSKRNATAYTSATKSNILLERRKELIFEGFRWDDLMRTGSAIESYGTLMELLATYNYPNNVFAYPIPAAELNANSNIEQNEGY